MRINVAEAIQYIRNINPQHIKSQKQLDDLIGYFERKGGYIANSGVRKKAGLRNCSNGVEELNMLNVADRQKDKLMSWREDGSSSLSAISTLFVNGEEKDWFFNHCIAFKPMKAENATSAESVNSESDSECDLYVLPDSAEGSICIE